MMQSATSEWDSDNCRERQRGAPERMERCLEARSDDGEIERGQRDVQVVAGRVQHAQGGPRRQVSQLILAAASMSGRCGTQ